MDMIKYVLLTSAAYLLQIYLLHLGTLFQEANLVHRGMEKDGWTVHGARE